MYLNEPNSVPPCGVDEGTPLQTASEPTSREGIPSGLLGLSAQQVPLRDETRRRYNLDVPLILLAISVDPSGLAGKARLQHGDLILGLAGQPAASLAELERIVTAVEPGREIVFRVIRMGRELLLGVIHPGRVD